MICIICNGDKVIERNEQVEICDNCDGDGEVVTKEEGLKKHSAIVDNYLGGG